MSTKTYSGQPMTRICTRRRFEVVWFRTLFDCQITSKLNSLQIHIVLTNIGNVINERVSSHSQIGLSTAKQFFIKRSIVETVYESY